MNTESERPALDPLKDTPRTLTQAREMIESLRTQIGKPAPLASQAAPKPAPVATQAAPAPRPVTAPRSAGRMGHLELTQNEFNCLTEEEQRVYMRGGGRVVPAVPGVAGVARAIASHKRTSAAKAAIGGSDLPAETQEPAREVSEGEIDPQVLSATGSTALSKAITAHQKNYPAK